MVRYYISNEDATAFCEVEVERLDDGFINFHYSFSSTTVDEIDWEEFGRITEECELWRNTLVQVIDLVPKDINWAIEVIGFGKGDGVIFECVGYSGRAYHLGTLAECYDDCDDCDRYCYSFKNDSPYENKCDCPNYCRCEEVFGYDEDGDYNSLWDFKCQCTKINGREKLLKILP